MSQRPDRYYRSSGAVPLSGTLLMLIGGLAAAIPLSLLYSLAEVHVTHQKVKMALVVLFALLMAVVIRGLARGGAVRNRSFAAFVGFVLGVLTLYFAWMWFLVVLGGWNRQDLLRDPVWIWQQMEVRARNGLWRNRRGPIPPGELALWWTGEALILIGACTWAATRNTEPYCETCARWTEPSPPLHLPFTVRASLVDALEEERYEELFKLDAKAPTADREISALVYSCPDCQDANYLTLNVLTYKSKKGEIKTETATFLSNLAVPHQVAKWIRDRAGQDPSPRLTGESDEQAGSLEVV